MSVIAGRSGPPHSAIPDWVGLADISPQAHSLYVKLSILVKGMDRLPDGATYKAITGGASADDVHTWLAELVGIGAITVDPTTNMHTIEEVPPDGYTGPVNLRHWTALHFPPPPEPPAPAYTPPPPRRATATPRRTALYRHFDVDDVLLYVGISVGPGGRFDGHAASAVWFPFAHHATWEWFPDRPSAEAAEIRAIRTEMPLFNREHAVPGTAELAAKYLREHAASAGGAR